MKSFLEFLLALGIVVGIAYALTTVDDPSAVSRAVDTVVQRVTPAQPLTYVITGDVMLGRNVRNLMRTYGDDFPFANSASILANADAVIINLEGPITTLDAPDERVSPEQPYSMRFAFDPSSAQTLHDVGITHVSVANNHAGDQGREGKADTRQYLTKAGVEYFGAPWGLTVGTAAHVRFSGHDVALLGIDDTITQHDIPTLQREIESFGTSTHVIVFMHWGDEYQLIHNERQETLAHALIDAGIDAVIGSHPHVVQDIEVYKGVPIFYSLGNFVFDQYWSADVQTGLTLRVTHDGGTQRYELVPIAGNHSQPKPMDEPARQAFLDVLAERSQPALAGQIKAGVVEL